jgi:hypothetical protein
MRTEGKPSPARRPTLGVVLSSVVALSAFGCRDGKEDAGSAAARLGAQGGYHRIVPLVYEGQFVEVRDINNKGAVVGTIYKQGLEISHAFRYEEQGGLVELSVPAPDLSRGEGINDRGEVAGTLATTRWHNWSERGFRMTPAGAVEVLTPDVFYAKGIDRGGRVAGHGYTTTGLVVWRAEGTVFEELGFLQGPGYDNSATVLGVGPGGETVGYNLMNGYTTYHAFIHRDGQALADLNTLSADPSWELLMARATSGRYVVGTGKHNGSLVGYRLDLSTGAVVDLGWADPYDVNSAGHVVGPAFFYSDETSLVSLLELVDPALGWSALNASAINDADMVAGTGTLAGRLTPFTLTLPDPRPAPPTPAIDWVMAPHYPGFETLPTNPPPPACELPPELVGRPEFSTRPCTVAGEPGCRIIFQNQGGTINGGCTALPNASPACQLPCGSPGIEMNGTCIGVELCNGKDDDCDGAVDNDGVCQIPHSLLALGVKPQYENPLPPVPTIQCQLTPELQGVPGFFPLPCGTVNGAPACQPWFTNQAGTVQAGACAPPPCTPGSRASCVLACGPIGTHVCSADGTWPSCQGIERCNSKDDDCDGSVDEGGVCQISLPPGVATVPPPNPGPVPPPISSVCTLPPELQGIPGFFVLPCGTVDGVPNCQSWFTNQAGTTQVGACAPLPCTPGAVASCALGCGGTGTRTCNAAGTWASCGGTCKLPIGFDTELNGCGSVTSGSPIVQYVWDVQLPDRVVHFTSMACRTDFVFPAEDTYPVTLTVVGQDGGSSSVTRDVEIKNHVIVSLGDSIASGEGNPDIEAPANNGQPVWHHRRCHRSLLSGHGLASRDVETADNHTSVTFLSLACSGATILEGLLGPYAGQQPDGTLEQAQILVAQGIFAPHPRAIDALLLQVGANDIGFANRAEECAIPPYTRPSDTELAIVGIFSPQVLPLLLVPEHLDLTSCATSNNIDFIADLLANLLDVPNVNLPSLYDRLNASIQQRLNVAPQHVFIADYPDPTNFAIGYCDEIRFKGAVDDESVARLPAAGASFLISSVGEPELGAIRFLQSSTSDGIITKPELIFAHEQVVVPLNAAVRAAAARFNWTHVAGANATPEFATHGYCLPGSQRWFRHYDESKAIQGNKKGTLHPNARGHDSYRRHLTPILLQSLAN